MQITTSGFYDISGKDNIELGDNIEVSLYYGSDKNIEVSIGENSCVYFYSFLTLKEYNSGEIQKIKVIQREIGSQLFIRSLLMSDGGKKLDVQISSLLSGNNTASDVKILSIAGQDGNISLDGIIEIKKGISGVKARLEEENLFLGTSGKIQGIPTLLVESNDVEASHSCKMERISDEKLFYLRSRGVEKENALHMMLESYVRSIFGELGTVQEELLEDIILDLFSRLK